MKTAFQIALGLLAAIGGFVDIGDLVFATQAGAAYRYQLIWAIVVGVIGIALYAEMCGRVAAVTKRPVMTVVRQRLGFRVGAITLVSSVLLSLLTLAAEVGGIGLILELLFDFSYQTLVLLAVLALIVVVWVLPFGGIERVFGYMGLFLLVFVVGGIHLHPDWSALGQGFVPSAKDSTLYAYFAVGLMASALMPYEVYLYSSGAVEERWGPSSLGLNRINAILGFALGGILAIGLLVVAAEVFNPMSVQPEFIGSTALGAGVAFGQVGLVCALIGMLFTVGGASIDTCFSGAYNVSQFFGWEWGKYRTASGAPRFALAWLAMFILAYVIVSTGVDPVMLTEVAVVFSVVVLPITYLPVLLIARDRTFMGQHANGRFSTVLGWIYLVILSVLALAAVPLLLITNAGSG